MNRLILIISILFGANLSAQISTFAELKAGMMIPQTVNDNSGAVQQGSTYGFDIGINLDESNSIGISINYGKDGYDNQVTMNGLFKGNSSREVTALQGSSSSQFSVGIISRTANTSLSKLFYPYAKLFLGYSYITISGIENQNQFIVSVNSLTENKFTAMFGLGFMVPIKAIVGGLGFEADYIIYMSENENERSLSLKFLYRYDLKFN
ncbi:MAG: hypothetical protein IH852_09225 [Bacteroidetes bacterium]|nr:hypothetical protein [Bacteroidota bacterium]